MSKKVEKVINGKGSKIWLWTVVIAGIIPWLGNAAIGMIYRSYPQGMSDTEINSHLSQMSGMLTLISLAALALMIAALFHVEGKLKLIVIAGIVSTIYVGYMAFFSYTWLM